MKSQVLAFGASAEQQFTARRMNSNRMAGRTKRRLSSATACLEVAARRTLYTLHIQNCAQRNEFEIQKTQNIQAHHNATAAAHAMRPNV
jgi:hypothetical protein